MMLALEKVRQIEQLLADGELSQRQIARRAGVSRGSVATIALGRRPDYEALRREKAEREIPAPSGPPRRCPTCRALVRMPCVACRVRRDASAVGSVLTTVGRLLDEPLGVDLKPHHRRRYERVRARRERIEAKHRRDEARQDRAAGHALIRMEPRDLLAALALDE
jgi:hypothetical protein